MDDCRAGLTGHYGTRRRIQGGSGGGVDSSRLHASWACHDVVPTSRCVGSSNRTPDTNRHYINLRNIRHWVAVVCALGVVGAGVRAYQCPVTVTYIGSQRWRIKTSADPPSVGANTWRVSIKSNTAMSGGVPTAEGQYWNTHIPLGSTAQYIYTDASVLKLFAILYSDSDPTLPSQTWQYTLTENLGHQEGTEYEEPSESGDVVSTVMDDVRGNIMNKLSTIGLRLGQLLSLILAIVWIKRDWKRRMRNENG